MKVATVTVVSMIKDNGNNDHHCSINDNEKHNTKYKYNKYNMKYYRKRNANKSITLKFK